MAALAAIRHRLRLSTQSIFCQNHLHRAEPYVRLCFSVTNYRIQREQLR